MIRKYNEGDLDRLMEIWLNENLSAHEFVDADYWKNNVPYVREALTEADLYIYEEDNQIKGFAGVVDGYLAGIFVTNSYHRQGIGQRLLSTVKENYNEIALDVYEKNKQAYQFYLKNQFDVIAKKVDEESNEVELTMLYKAE
ncbi:N-acetyltransferase [Vagococcus coleopterorum]|uniref:N-acetyltransferase n=1 Tax=Vagococcus coleopterorum TaxID=2714946 RepID=A0A6G8ANV6_9ENTE|nr:N-acetyltransferase [Vagococcus coleopterorum]QIL46764.1 N-acetyltransferase [Vagococcus coleopterorum]